MTQPMVERGLVAEVELLRMQRQFNELNLQVSLKFLRSLRRFAF